MLTEIEQLKITISRLCQLKLISEDQKLRLLKKENLSGMKAEMYDFLVKKDLAMAMKVILAIRDFESDMNAHCQQETNDDIPNSSHQNEKPNPLENILVINKIFRFLGWTDIKNFRLVNKSWNSAASPLLRKRSTIVFSRSALHNPALFTETFIESQMTLPFTSFKFKDDWPISDLTNFFQERKSEVKGISFKNLKLFDGNESVRNYDISPWIEDSSIIKLKVNRKGCSESNTNLRVSLSSLTSLKFITLKYCDIIVNRDTDTKVTPQQLNLTWVKFYLEGHQVNEILINNYVDFKEAVKVSILFNQFEPVITFDFSRSFKMDQLKLQNVQGINWANNDPKSTVKKLYLTDVEFIEKTSLNIKEMHFSKGTVDLYALPPQLAKIYVSNMNDERDIMSCTRPINLHNLTFLKFQTNYSYNGIGNDLSLLSHFSHCANLVNIDISNTIPFFDQPQNITLSLMWIPRSVKSMKMTGQEVVLGLSYGRKLIIEKLVLDKCDLSQAVDVLSKIKPSTLVMKLDQLSKHIGKFILFLQQFKTMENVLIGPFDWNCMKNEKNRLNSYVKTKASYYHFQNQVGSAIDEKYFQNMASLDETN